MANTFGDYIRGRRLALGLTQAYVAKAVGFKSLAYLSDIEGGNRSPGLETLPALAEVLQVTLDDLEAHDPRAPVADIKQLLENRPDLVAAFRRVVKSAHHLSSEDLIARVETPLADEKKRPFNDPSQATWGF